MGEVWAQVKVIRSDKLMQYQSVILISDCWKFSVKTHLYYCICRFVPWPDWLSKHETFCCLVSGWWPFFTCPTMDVVSLEIKKICQSSSYSTHESFLFQIDRLILHAQTHVYCKNLSALHLTFCYIDFMNTVWPLCYATFIVLFHIDNRFC